MITVNLNTKALVYKIMPLDQYIKEVNTEIKETVKSTKFVFTFADAKKYRDAGSERCKLLINVIDWLKSNPLKNNDYFKYVNAYSTSKIKLDEKYFRHDLDKLHSYYDKVDKEKKYNPFNVDNYNSYVIYMSLKLYGFYSKKDDEIFNIKINGHREYNTLSAVQSVLRGDLPFNVKEYDIKRAFPTFIDIQLNSDYRHDVYEILSKKDFSTFLNSHSKSKVSIDVARTGLSKVYKERVTEVLTDDRYNNSGKVFEELTSYEKEYIERFISENELTNYARLHDGLFVLSDVNVTKLTFDTVEFSIKECIKPKIINNKVSFYSVNHSTNEVETSPTMYADFLKQNDFLRISTPDDKIYLLHNKNNVIDYFNHKTNMVSFLESEINEVKKDAIKDKVAKENNSVLASSYPLLPFSEIEYHKDKKDSFGLPFKNGFHYFENSDITDIKVKPYKEVKGFFTPHEIQSIDFNYTDEVGDFEKFIQRISTGVKDIDASNDEHRNVVNAFNSMLGYYCHNHKDKASNPAIVLTDEGANDVNRNGGRGKSLIYEAIELVQKTLVKGGNEFKADENFNLDDLDKSIRVYVLDDVDASFKYDSIYTKITGGINAQKKFAKAVVIPFEDAPKFLITSNWLVRYDEKNVSTNRRFIEYKIKPYYGLNHTPVDEFEKRFYSEWDKEEWDKFYSFIFRCVSYYINNGLERITYDKTEDNFKASFNNDASLDEMERIINYLLFEKRDKRFKVKDFLAEYRAPENPMKLGNLFHEKNAKKLIDIYLKHKLTNYNIKYSLKFREWYID